MNMWYVYHVNITKPVFFWFAFRASLGADKKHPLSTWCFGYQLWGEQCQRSRILEGPGRGKTTFWCVFIPSVRVREYRAEQCFCSPAVCFQQGQAEGGDGTCKSQRAATHAHRVVFGVRAVSHHHTFPLCTAATWKQALLVTLRTRGRMVHSRCRRMRTDWELDEATADAEQQAEVYWEVAVKKKAIQERKEKGGEKAKAEAGKD